MGFIDGFLGGVVSQRQRIADQNREDAQQSQAREDAVLQHMSTSDDPEIKALGVAGILHSTDPKQKKSGFQGWLGQVQSSPYMDKARALVAHDQAAGHLIPTAVAHAAGQHATAGDPATAAATLISGAQTGGEAVTAPPGSPAGDPTAGGSAPTPPKSPTMATEAPTAPTAGGAAMPAGPSLTEVGSAPPGPTAATPGAEATPADTTPPILGAQPSPAAVLGQAAPAGPAPASVTPQPAAGVGSPPPPAGAAPAPGIQPTAVLGQATPEPPEGTGPLSPRGDVFPSVESGIRKGKIASAQGDVEGLSAGLKAAGFSPEEIKAQLKLHFGRGTGASLQPKSVAGAAPDETGAYKPAFAAFVGGQYIDANPDSANYGMPMPNFRPNPAGGQPQHAGTAVNDAHQRLYGTPFNQGTPETQNAAQAEVEKTAGRMTTARGVAQNDVKLDAPIGTTNAMRYGVPPTTTMRQLQQRIPLSQADQDKMHGITTLEGSMDTVDGLITKVFPDYGPGIVGRARTALSLFGQSAGRQEDITKLNSAIASTMVGIVRANGVTQRLNQEEIKLAKQQMIDTSALHGDTLESAQAKMEILRGLIARVQSTGPTGVVAPGVGAPPPAPGAPAAAAPAAGAKPGAAPAKGSAAGPAGMKMVKDASGAWVLAGADGKPLP